MKSPKHCKVKLKTMSELKELRQEIDDIDGKLAGLLRERAATVKKIQQLKKAEGLPVIDTERENAILSRLRSDYEREIFKSILEESRKLSDIER